MPVADDDFRALAGQIADFEHDILPAQERAAERVAAFRIPPPQPSPPSWQRWLYWSDLWRLSSGFRAWAEWEQTHSPNYGAVRLGANLLILSALSAVALATLTGAARGWLAFQIGVIMLRHIGAGLRRIDRSGRGRKLLVAPAEMSTGALALRNAARISALVLVFTVAVAVPHVL